MRFKKKPISPEAQAKKAKLQEIAARLKDMTSEERQAWISRLGIVVRCEDGAPLSIGNSLLLWYQDESVTMVGGYRQWQAKGRQVRQGSRSYGIFAPLAKKEEQSPSIDTKDDQSMRFRFVSVFDVSQTDPMTDKATEEVDAFECEYVN